MSTQQSLFAQVTSQPGGIVMVQLIGPSIGQREVPIITEMVVPAIEKFGSALRFVVLDMTQITFMNSMGLGMCIDFRNRSAKAKGKAVLMGMNKELADLFRMVKVDKLYSIAKDAAELAKILSK